MQTSRLTLRFPLIFGAILAASLPTALFAQEIAPAGSSDIVAFDSEEAAAGRIVFSNLDAGNSYNTDAFAARAVAGRQAGGGQTERWGAVRFTPKVDVQAMTLSAAIGYISGTKLVNLALYTEDDFFIIPRDPLPGGEGSTQDIPPIGQCCQLANVTLPGEGVTLRAGVSYWLVAKPDNVSGPTFSGKWHVSNRGSYAFLQPPFPWGPSARRVAGGADSRHEGASGRSGQHNQSGDSFWKNERFR